MTPARPILVVGSPRSGTTMLSTLIGTARNVVDLGEYGALYASHYVLPLVHRRLPTPVADAYLAAAQRHALDFARECAARAGAEFFVDGTPWNLLVLPEILAIAPDAVVVLALRHYRGVVQSLERSDRDGYEWAGATAAERARLWARFYAQTARFPPARAISFGYDRFASAPEAAIVELRAELAAAGIDAASLDLASLAATRATQANDARPVAGALREGGAVLRPFPSFDAEAWDEGTDRVVEPIVAGVDARLRRLYPDDYREPHGIALPPAALPA
jgi:Sulfotransferase family